MVYRISEVAQALRCSAGSLRLWEKEGLIPKPERRLTGLREYSEEDLKKIREFLESKSQRN